MQAIAGAILEVPVIRAESYCPVCRAGSGMRQCDHCWATGRTLAIRWVPVAMPAGVLCDGGFGGLLVPRQGHFDWSERSFGPLRVMVWPDPEPEPAGFGSSRATLSMEWPHLSATVERRPGSGAVLDLLGLHCEVPADEPDGEWRRVPGAGLLRLSHADAPDAIGGAGRGDLIVRLSDPGATHAHESWTLLERARAAQAAGRPVAAMVCAALAGREGGERRGRAGTLAASREVLDDVAESFFVPPEDLPPEAREPALAALAAMRRPTGGGRFVPAFNVAIGHDHYRACADGAAWSVPWFRLRALAVGLLAGLAHDPATAGTHLAGAALELGREPATAGEADDLVATVLDHLPAVGRAAFCSHWLWVCASDRLAEEVERAVAGARTAPAGAEDGPGLASRWLSFWLIDAIAAAAPRPDMHALRDALARRLLGDDSGSPSALDALTDSSRELRAVLAADSRHGPGGGLLGRLAPEGVNTATASAAATEALALATWAWSRPGHGRALAAAESLLSAPDAAREDAPRENAAVMELLSELERHERGLFAAGEAIERAASAGGSEDLRRLAALLDGFRTRACIAEAHVCLRLARASEAACAPQQALRWLDRAVGHANGALTEQARLRHTGLSDDRTSAYGLRALARAFEIVAGLDESRPVARDDARRFVENTLDAAFQGIIPLDTRFRVEDTEDIDTLHARLAPELPHLFENSEAMTREFLVDVLPGWYWLTSYRLLLRVPEAGHVQFLPLQSVRSYRVIPDAVTTSTVSISLRDGRTVNLNGMPNRHSPSQDAVEYVLGLKLWEDLPPVEAKAVSVGGRIAPSQRAALPLYAVPEGLPPASLSALALPDAAAVLAAIDGPAGRAALDAVEEEAD